jgi:drug/metabolite transporter (DMT)-like permease
MDRQGSTAPRWRDRLNGNATLVLTMAPLMWACNAIAGKIAADLISPVTLTFLRWMMALCILAPIAGPHLARDLGGAIANWRRLFIMGAVGFTGFNLSLYYALNYTTALNVSIEQASMPAVIMLGSFLLARQKVSALQGLGVILSIAGVLFTATRGNPEAILQLDLNRGDAIMMLGVVCYSGFTVALRNKPPLHWLSLMFVMSVGALLAASVVFAAEVAIGGFTPPGPRAWMLVVFTAIFPSLVAQFCFMRGVELVGANRAGMFINLVPIFAAVLAVTLLGEAFHLYHFTGLVLVFAGIAMASR